MKRILVTGGAGYIGSHTALALVEAGHEVVVVDNLHSGRRAAVPARAKFAQGDIADQQFITDLLRKHRIEAVLHFAAYVVVPESLAAPRRYYRNNVVGSLNLIEACLDSGIAQLVFSSSAAVYGLPRRNPVAEDAVKTPINPYGSSKLITEWSLQELAAATNGKFKFVALRYFNVAGARADGKLGQAGAQATHLIKVCCQAACRTRAEVRIFGDDYPTADGTCIRDYIHVEDLVSAHISALHYLDDGGENVALNCGYGRGFSVQQVVACMKAVSHVDFAVKVVGRRAGDPPELVADNALIQQYLNWKPRYDDLSVICDSAYRWEQTLRR